MMPTIAASALQQARNAKGWSQEQLAERAKIDKGTISRLERSKHSVVRNRTLDQLCAQLSVTREMLIGDVPLPARDVEPPAWMNNSQLNIRIANDARNALALVSSRYGVPQSNIVELAPFLFLCAAESCLKNRAERVAALEAKFDEAESLRKNFAHLSPVLINLWRSEEILDSEKASIKARELFFTHATSIMPVESLKDDYEDYYDSPFVKHLSDMAHQAGDGTTFEDWGGTPTYKICENEALLFAGDNKEAANQILDGMAPLHEMPKELRRPENIAERVQWIVQRASESKRVLEEFFGTIANLVPDEAKDGKR